MSILRISLTISRMRSKPRFRPDRSLHAAPIQKRVLPFAFALRAASNTGSISSRREAFVGVVYLDDCEQYEPEHHEHDLDRSLSARSPHNLRYSLQLQTDNSCQTCCFILAFGYNYLLLMFINVHNWTLLGSWCCLCTLAARKTRSSSGES